MFVRRYKRLGKKVPGEKRKRNHFCRRPTIFYIINRPVKINTQLTPIHLFQNVLHRHENTVLTRCLFFQPKLHLLN